MKKKKLKKKLILKKEVIENLNQVKGGYIGTIKRCLPSVDIDCPGTFQGDCI